MKNYLIRRIKAFGYAIEGLAYALRYHPSIFYQLLAGFIVTLLGLYFGVNRIEWAILLLTIFAVVTCELLNTAIEVTLDHMTKDHHLRVKYAKDVAAGAVFFMSIGAVLVGYFVFQPYLFRLIYG